MRLCVLVGCAALLLTGCQHFSYMTKNDFDRGNVPQIQFDRDSYNCEVEAVVQQNMVRGGDLHGVFNDTYARCMHKYGYRTTDVDVLGFGG